MLDNAKEPDTGFGPYGVERSEDDHQFHITLNGERTGKTYPLGKTAYRKARDLNADHAGRPGAEAAPTYLEEEGPGIVAGLDLSGTVEEIEARYPGWSKDEEVKEAKATETPQSEAGEPTHSTATFQGTREEWLNAFVAAARPIFKARGHELPEKIRVSVGFMFRSSKAIGQCWHAEASTDGTREIFVTPTLDDSETIASVLTHELVHTLFGGDEKHGKNFKAAGTAVGLVGKPTHMIGGPEWELWARPILAKLGGVPHARLDPLQSGVKKQTTRLLKGECAECGFTVRLTAKWVNQAVGTLRCPDSECSGDLNIDTGEAAGEG